MLRLEATAEAMGAPIRWSFTAKTAKMEAASDEAFEEARRLDDLLSNYKPESEWSKVNREAADHPVAVSPELFDLIAACVRYSRESEGAFDITVGPLMKVWGFYKGTGHLPKAMRSKGGDGTDRVPATSCSIPRRTDIAFRKKGLNLDPGGIGKGYAVDRMAELIRKGGIRSAHDRRFGQQHLLHRNTSR